MTDGEPRLRSDTPVLWIILNHVNVFRPILDPQSKDVGSQGVQPMACSMK
jgi:hypothetical protein